MGIRDSGTPAARELYASVRDLPILDYHCHLDQFAIARDDKFGDVGGDGFPARRGYLVRHFLAGLQLEVYDADARAALGESLGERAHQHAARARYGDDFFGKINFERYHDVILAILFA